MPVKISRWPSGITDCIERDEKILESIMTRVLRLITELIEPFDESGIVDDLFGSLRDRAERGEIPVILFCAGSSGSIFYRLLIRQGIHPTCFCDNNPSRAGKKHCDIPILSFEELKNLHRDSLILIASAAYQNLVKSQLLAHGFNPDRIITLDTDDPSPDVQIRRERILMLARNGEPSGVLERLRNDEDKICAAFDLFADDKSRDLFVRRLALIASGYEHRAYKKYLEDFSEPVLRYGFDNPERFTVPGSYFYFNNDVLHIHDDEVLVDGGAFCGDSVEEFIRACKNNNVRYKHIFCYEPDPSNYRQLLENTSGYRDVTCFPLGLWSSKTELRFLSSERTESYCARIHDSGTAAQDIADLHIETANIDGQPAHENMTIFKLDIEGAEMEAIAGAAKTIRNSSPQLALSVYHNTSDLYNIPLFVHRLNPGYKLYLRHFGNYFDDTMLLT
ncbi:MAG: FkbM family methyltransferase [Syntrophobacteraceae bacterium]